MGFLDIIKNLIPDFNLNLNVDNRRIDNRKIEIKGNTITCGKDKIDDPVIVDKIFKAIEEHKEDETLPFELIHKDLSDDFEEFENISIRDKSSLSKLKTVLPSEEVECILMARRVYLAHQKVDEELSKELMSQLIKNFPKNGKKVFNLMSAGYFDEMVMPFIDIMQENSNEDDDCKCKFYNFYKDLMRFFPVAVFVGNGTTEDKLEDEILKRFKLKEIPFIRVHAISSSNIKKVENVINKIEKEYSFNIHDKRFKTTWGIVGQLLEIKIRK